MVRAVDVGDIVRLHDLTSWDDLECIVLATPEEWTPEQKREIVWLMPIDGVRADNGRRQAFSWPRLKLIRID